ncbi:MAG: peptidylprolyl isomerase [Polyangiales bacterium]
MHPQRFLVVLATLLSIAQGCSMGEPPPPPAAAHTPERAAAPTPPPAAPTPPPAAAAPPAAPATPAPTDQLLPPPAEDERAPNRFTVVLETTKGNIELDVHRDWSPHGADRFYTLVKRGYYTDVAFFRVIPGFMAQVGLHGDPRVTVAWREHTIPDDPVVEHNTRGRVSFATAGPNTRTTQFFVNYRDNSRLDGMGFSPFAEVRDMAVVDALFGGYGEGQPRGMGPSQGLIHDQGNAYLRAQFPNLDYIRSARVVQ